MPEPESGLLAPVDREWLRGEKEYDTRQGRHQREQAIRARVRNGIRDFSLLMSTLTHEEIDEIFEPYPGDNLRRGVQSAISMLFVGVTDEVEENPMNQPYSPHFNKDLEEGLSAGVTYFDWFLDEVDLTLEAEHIEDAEQLIEMVEEGENFRPGFIQFAMKTDLIEGDSIQKAFREEIRNQLPDIQDGEE